MALAKRSRGGMSGWLAAGLLALGVFAAVSESTEPAASDGGSSGPAIEVTLQD